MSASLKRICAAILEALSGGKDRPLAGRRALVTAGPTAEPVDPVRVLTNRSSGKQGFAIAAALANLGAEVTLVAGPVAEPTPPGVRRVDVETAREMLAVQASDWAFLDRTGQADDYPFRRSVEHAGSAYEAIHSAPGESIAPDLRSLAPDLDLAPLSVP